MSRDAVVTGGATGMGLNGCTPRTPADIGAACAFLCSDDAGYITGQQINVNGGWYL